MEIPKWLKVTFALVVFIVATLATVWLAGFLFFVFSKANPFGKTDFMTFYRYWQGYQADPVIGKRLNLSALCAAFIAYGGPIVAWLAVSQQTKALHGEARFATASEIKKSGLMAVDGILVGKFHQKYLIFPGQKFVLLAAPTRSGKGVGMVIPNLLNFKDSVVVLDIKQENYYLTAGFRAQHGQQVFLFNPFAEDCRTCRYNPLGYVRDDNFRISDLIAIGEVFYPSGNKDPFFDDQARNLFVGLGLYLCETPTLPRTIGEMLRQSSGKGQPIKDYLDGIIKERNYEVDEEGNIIGLKQWDGKSLPPLTMECVDALNRFTSNSYNTRASILASFNAPLGIWLNPMVDAATSENDFDLRDVRKQRISIYVGIAPNHLAEASRLVNLFFSQLLNLNTEELPQDNPALKYQCLLLMDEFTAIGRVGIIANAIAYMSGYNLRLLTIIQSLAQINDDPPSGYGRQVARTLITNHACQILYAPREQEDAEAYSKMLGTETVKSKSFSRQLGGSYRSESVADQGRALLLAQEIKEIGQTKQIIILENTKPILCDKIQFFKDRAFIDRLKMISPSLRALGRKLPTQEQLDEAVRRRELAPLPPLLDIEAHRASLQACALPSVPTRPATLTDTENGIDLSKLAIDLAKIPIPEGDGVEAEDVQAFVDGFFDALDKANERDKTS